MSDAKIRKAVKEERERIRKRMIAYLESLRTHRPDDYGVGWNGCLSQILSGVRK